MIMLNPELEDKQKVQAPASQKSIKDHIAAFFKDKPERAEQIESLANTYRNARKNELAKKKPEGVRDTVGEVKKRIEATNSDPSALDRLTATKGLVSILRIIANIVDLVPALGLDDLGAATVESLAAGIQTSEAIVRGDKEATVKAITTGTVRTGVAAVPFAEYLSIADKAVGGVTGKDTQFAPEEIISNFIDGVAEKHKLKKEAKAADNPKAEASEGKGAERSAVAQEEKPALEAEVESPQAAQEAQNRGWVAKVQAEGRDPEEKDKSEGWAAKMAAEGRGPNQREGESWTQTAERSGEKQTGMSLPN